MGRAGDGSTLSLDFTAMGGVLDPRITFSRADATALATFINSSGFVETVATAQAPRFTFSETSIGTPRGLLLEAPATNLLQRSVALDQNPWFTGGSMTRSTFTGGAGPDNVTNSGSKLSAVNIDASTAFYYNGVTVVSGTTYTYSLWAKADGANWIWVTFDYFGGKNGAFFDLSGNGALGNTTGTVVAGSNTITKYPNGWFRLTVAHAMSGSTIFYPSIIPCTSNGTGIASITGQSPNGVLVYGAQVEAGSQASSFIPTVASTVTRAVDTAIIAAGSNFSSWYTGGTTGTFVTEWCRCSPTTTQRTVIATSDVSNQHLHQYIAATTSRLRLADKVPAFIETANASVDNSINKGAFSYSGSVQSLCLNSGTVVPGTLAFSVAPTFLSIGGPSTNGTSITDTAVVLNNAIRKIKYFPTRLSDGQIQGLTA